MKKIFTLCALTFSILCGKTQVVLNEIYVQPGVGYNEFFELYNTDPGPSSENLDNYTMITYYEESGKSGFYVMDLPNMSIAPKGYFVGASANPFNIQSQPNLLADFSWNSMPASGSLTKWENNGSGYTQVAIPANFNDFFVKTGGSGAVYHVLLYKNGVLVYGFIGGTNAEVIPPYMKSMPNLFVDMSGSAPDFTIDFNAIVDNSVEYTSMAVGTNNGYYREFDGKCGSWLKSDQPGQHNPGSTNGSATNEFGEIQLAASVSAYASDPSQSVFTYEIKSGPADAFPVVVDVYIDYDSIGLLETSDVLIDTRTILTAPSGNQDIIIPDSNFAVMLVLKSPAGCYDLVFSLERYTATLPVKLYNFRGSLTTNWATLNWTIANNETASHFEVERSSNGRDFTTVAFILSSEETGTADYFFNESINQADRVFYRLKITDKSQQVTYSELLAFQAKTNNNTQIKFVGNPVKEKLILNFATERSDVSDIRVYDLAGKTILNQKINTVEGINTISIPLNGTMSPGVYMVDIKNGVQKQSGKFIKL